MIQGFYTLENKIENNLTLEGAFYQSEWVEINSSWVIFIFFFFKCKPSHVSEWFCRPHLAIMNAFHTILNFHFNKQILYPCKLASPSWWESAQVRESTFFLGNEWN